MLPKNPHQQARLIKPLVSNSTFDRGSVFSTYVKSFDVFAKGSETGDWLAALDDFRPGLFGRPREARSNSHSLRRDSNPDASYSYFNALIGSTRDARCAGMKPAQSATSASATAESASTAGSAPVI
jgi:hypothetical protein